MDQELRDSAELGVGLDEGARNLLLNCVGLEAGESLLVVGEAQADAWFEPELCSVVAEVAAALGAHPQVMLAPEAAGPEAMPETVAAGMLAADHTVFLSRLGDQVRFSRIPGGGTKTMCCLFDRSYLGDAFSRVPYGVFAEVGALLLTDLAGRRRCRITCPAGTDLEGRVVAPEGDSAPLTQDFSLKYFPVMITPPLPAAGLSGRLALGRWLLSTSTHAYDGSVLEMTEPLFAEVRDGKIARFHGDAAQVAEVERHFHQVAALFGGDPYAVNSWHCGINPKTFYAGQAEADVEKWSSVVYGSPRYTHFHACGKDPGDIAISLIDATISFDGEVYWNSGRFRFLDRPHAQRILKRYPGSDGAYDMRWDIGI